MSDVIIGEGAWRYRIDQDFPKLPEGYRFGTTHGVVEDAAGRIYIHHKGSPSVFVFEPDGTFVTAWGEEYSTGAHGMHLNRESDGEFLYLSATSLGMVVKTTLSGEEVLRITAPPRPDIYDEERRFVPTEATVAPDGTIFVADGYGQSWVHRYSPSGDYLDSFGGPGSEVGRLDCPHGIMLDTRGATPRILVSDRKNVRLHYFTLDGEPLHTVSGMLRHPCTTVERDGYLYIPDLFSRLTILGPDDALVAHLADWPECWKRDDWPNVPREEWVPGRVSSPHDLHVDAAGTIYLVEWMTNATGKVTRFERISS